MAKTLGGAALAALMVVACSQAGAAGRRLSANARQAMTWYGGDMEKDIRAGTTPHVIVMNVNGKVTSDRQFDYGTHKPGQMRVTGLGKSGNFKVVMLLPVSGHTGEAAKFARSNRYNVTVAAPGGATWSSPKIASTGLVTPKELTLKLTKGLNVLEFWPDGSGGPGGYVEGRRYHITWDGK